MEISTEDVSKYGRRNTTATKAFEVIWSYIHASPLMHVAEVVLEAEWCLTEMSAMTVCGINLHLQVRDWR